jgi:outer membrane immunogenic protein
MPLKAAPAAIANDGWTGFYAGIIGGYGTGPAKNDPTGFLASPVGAFPTSLTIDGGFVGGQLGYDYQFNNGVVLGIVGDGAWANMKGSVCTEVPAGGCSGDPRDAFGRGKINWLATDRGRLGLAFNPQMLLYATGGAAFAGVTAEDTFIDGVHNVSAHSTRDGYAVGVGGEYRIVRNMSFGLEYLYEDFGTKTVTFNSTGLGGGLGGQLLTVDSKLKLNILKASLNYRW